MSVPQQKQQYNKQPYRPKYETQNKSFIPENEQNGELRNKLFLYFTEGDFLKIKDFILSNHLIINTSDENDNNILHMIIQNETLTENQKIELIKLALSLGIDVSYSNRYNITPLHLACQIQSKKIIQLLLEKGAEINKTDSEGKSVVHYAVVGKNIACPTSDISKVKSITKKNINEKTDKILQELRDDINKIVIGDLTNPNNNLINTNLKHLKAYFDDYKNIFPEKYRTFSENATKIISDVLSDTKISTNDKLKVLLQKMLGERDNLFKEFENITNHENIINLTIQSGQKDGWYPNSDANKINTIMKKYDVDDRISFLQNEIDELKMKSEQKINKTLNELNQNLEKINDHYDFTTNCIGSLYYLLENLSGNNFIDNNSAQAIINLLKPNNQIDIKYPEIDINNNDITLIHPPIIPGAPIILPVPIQNPYNPAINLNTSERIGRLPEDYTYGEIKILLSKINALPPALIPLAPPGGLAIPNALYAVLPPSLQPPLPPGAPAALPAALLPILPAGVLFADRVRFAYLKLILNNDLNILLEQEYGNNFAPKFGAPQINNFNLLIQVFDDFLLKKRKNNDFIKDIEIDIGKKLIISLILETQNINPLHNNTLDNDIYYICSEYKFYKWRLGISIDKINEIKNNITNQINGRQFNLLLNDSLPSIIMSVINIGIILKNLQINYEKYKILQDKLEKDLSKLNFNNIADLQNNPLKWTLVSARIMVNQFKRQNEDIINIKEFYKTSLYPIIEWVNDTIKYSENISAFDIYTMYHRTKKDDDDLDPIDNILSHKFLYFNDKFPDSYDKFIDFFSANNLALMKKKYFENYIPKLSDKYNEIYYSPGPNVNSRKGYLMEQVKKQNCADGMSGNPGDYNLNVNNDITDRAGNIIFEFGNIGAETSLPTNKSDLYYPIIFSIFGKDHIGMIKYQILTIKLNQIYDIINPPRGTMYPATYPIEDKIRNKVKEFEESIQNLKTDPNDHNAILVIIGNYIKNLIDKYVSDLAFRSSNKAILNVINQMNIPRFYKQLSERLQQRGLIEDELLAKKVEGYQLNLSKIYDNLFKNNTLTHRFGNISLIMQANLVEEPVNKYEGKIHKILNSNYHEIKSTKEVCYLINNDIIDLLYQYRANMNIKDKNGQNPIFTAIETKNIAIINKLLDNDSLVSQPDKNGNNAIEFALNLYKNSINNEYVNIYDICDRVTENTFGEFIKRHSNNLPINANIIFAIALHMLNHHFLTLAEKYYGEWTHKSFENLKNILGQYGASFDSLLPLLNVDFKPEDLGELDIYNQKIKQESKIIDKLEKEINDLNKKLLNLREEQTHITSKPAPLTQYNQQRLNSINIMIQDYHIELQNKINKLNNEKTTLNATNNQKNTNFTNPNRNFQTNKSSITYKNSVVDLYDSAFIDVINYNKRIRLSKNIYDHDTDYMTYSNIWRKYLETVKDNIKKESNIDHTSFMEIINIYQKNILNLNNNQSTYKQKLSDLSVIFTFYNKIVNPYVKNYLDLPREYGEENECLNVIINIIVHVLKRCILVSLYYEICANIQAYLEESFHESEGKVNQDMINRYLREILGDGINNNNGSKLANYIFNSMPLKLVKKTLNIYGNEWDDMDKNDLTIDSFFEDILNILKSNTAIAISTESPLIINLKDTTFMRHKEYIKLAIENMHLLMNNYLFYLYNQSCDINIIRRLSRNI
jgi:hypothetical protein